MRSPRQLPFQCRLSVVIGGGGAWDAHIEVIEHDDCVILCSFFAGGDSRGIVRRSVAVFKRTTTDNTVNDDCTV